jgi:hypothetical protein
MATTVSHTWQELINNPSLITNYYLYGQATKPTADQLVSDKWIRQQGVVDITIKISNYDSYITDGPGRYANASQIGVVSGFFESSLPNLQIGEKTTYTLSEAINKFGQNGTEGFVQSDFNGSLDGTNGRDYAARVYEFQTQQYLLNQNVKFVIERKTDGQYVKRIENFALLPRYEDFDFLGGSDLVNLGNDIIENDIDPSRIGRTVKIQYPSSAETSSYSTKTYTSASYAQDQIRFVREDHGTYLDAYQPVKNLVDQLWNTGTTKFIDPQGRAIYYGTNGNDPIIASNIGSKLTDYRLANQVGTVQIAGKGNDTLRGNNYGLVLLANKSDYLLGGDGNDTYFAGNKDIILDSDGSGAVYLGGEHLDGGEKKVIKHIGVTTTNYTKTFIYCECKTVTKWSDVSTDEWEEKEEYYIDKATGTKYILSNSTLSVISSSGTITINNFSNGQLGIHLSEKETIDKKNVERDVFLQEDFCSPLILDINNGTSSTGLGNSQTYFDMDGDGFKERTAWVEQGDGLLVLDRNGNGVIDNGTELFGNFTPLVRGNSASDGFEALLQYDENRDGIIDHNDAPYNQLKVWMDDNANGITDTGELKTLQEAKVASLKLNAYYKSQRKAA